MGCLELYPNCSEVTWRLDFTRGLNKREKIVQSLMDTKHQSSEFQTSGTESGALDNFLYMLKEEKKQGIETTAISLDITDNSGGNEAFVEDMWRLANRVMNGEISDKRAHQIEDNWAY